jgi:Transposase zinc-ribbon domain
MANRPSNRSAAAAIGESSTATPSSFPPILTVPQAASQSGSTPAFAPSALGIPARVDSALDPFYSPADLLRDFSNDDVCLEYIKEQIWPKGLAPCLKCGVSRKHYRVSGRKAYACNHCGHHIYPLAHSIFTKSTTPLQTWFYILYLMLSTRGLLSARQIQRETGVTYKTAWRSRAQILALLPPQSSYVADLNALLDVPPTSQDNAPEVVMKAPNILRGPREETRRKMRGVRKEEFTALAQRAIQTPSRKFSAAVATTTEQ